MPCADRELIGLKAALSSGDYKRGTGDAGEAGYGPPAVAGEPRLLPLRRGQLGRCVSSYTTF